jgi:predicted esterase
MAFSQGAALASMLMARDTFPQPFGFGIFICGGPPFSEKTIREENRLRYQENGLDRGGKPVITTPTIHLVGAQDPDLSEYIKLVALCPEEVRELYEHPAGHEIPSAPEVTKRMVETIQRGVEKAMRPQ